MKKNKDRHFWLFSKLHYGNVSDNVIEKLKVLQSEYSGVETKFIEERFIVSHLIEIVENIPGRTTLLDFLSSIEPHNVWKIGFKNKEKYDFNKAIILSCLQIMSDTKVSDIEGELGFIDPIIQKNIEEEIICQ